MRLEASHSSASGVQRAASRGSFVNRLRLVHRPPSRGPWHAAMSRVPFHPAGSRRRSVAGTLQLEATAVHATCRGSPVLHGGGARSAAAVLATGARACRPIMRRRSTSRFLTPDTSPRASAAHAATPRRRTRPRAVVRCSAWSTLASGASNIASMACGLNSAGDQQRREVVVTPWFWRRLRREQQHHVRRGHLALALLAAASVPRPVVRRVVDIDRQHPRAALQLL